MKNYKYVLVPIFYFLVATILEISALLTISFTIGFHGGTSEPPTCGTYGIFLSIMWAVPILTFLVVFLFLKLIRKVVKLKSSYLIIILLITVLISFVLQISLPGLSLLEEPGYPAWWCPDPILIFIYTIFISSFISLFLTILFSSLSTKD